MEERSAAAEAAAERKAEELEQMLTKRERSSAQLQAAIDAIKGRLGEMADAAAAAGPAQAAGAVDLAAETRRLRAELRDILDSDHVDARAFAAEQAADGSGDDRLTGPPALSRMRKADLVAECEGARPSPSPTPTARFRPRACCCAVLHSPPRPRSLPRAIQCAAMCRGAVLQGTASSPPAQSPSCAHGCARSASCAEARRQRTWRWGCDAPIY